MYEIILHNKKVMLRFGKIHYESKFAKIFLFKNYHTIMWLGEIYSKLKKKEYETEYENVLFPYEENHELIHVEQYKDCLIIGSMIGSVLLLLYPHLWYLWIIISLFFYYILYLGEYFFSFIIHLFHNKIIDANEKAYYSSALEMEAFQNQKNMTYLKTRKRFIHFKYYGKI